MEVGIQLPFEPGPRPTVGSGLSQRSKGKVPVVCVLIKIGLV